MVICAGLAAAARTRRRYPARTSRSTELPRGSPYPRSAAAAWVHACLTAQAQSVRGKLDRSGTPGWKSAISGGSGGWRPGEGAEGEGAEGGTTAGPARGWPAACWPLMPATRVADPVRLVRYPSASSCP